MGCLAEAMADVLALGRGWSGSGAAVAAGTLLAVLGGLVMLARAYIVPPRLRLKGKVVVITGGSCGIGKAVAKEVLDNGARVILVARGQDKLEAARIELLEGLGEEEGEGDGGTAAAAPLPRVVLVAQDVAAGEEPLVQALTPAIEQLGGRVDVLINCAGTSVSGAFDQIVEEAFEDMYRVNVLGSVFPTRAVLPFMKRQRGGAIVFVSSQAGQVGLWGYSAYSASKFALRGLAQALQMEVHPYNIFVSVAYPPDTDTPGFKVEELTKPAETTMICGAGHLFPPERVAKDLVRGVERRAFNVWTGLDGFMLSNLSCGMEPCFNLLSVVVQVLTCSLFRLVSLAYLLDFYRIAHRCSPDRHKAAEGVQPPKYVPQLPGNVSMDSSEASRSSSSSKQAQKKTIPGSVRWRMGGSGSSD